MSKLEKIQKEILSLSREEKELIEILVKDSQHPLDTDYDKAWQSELQKRLTEVQGGNVNLVSTKSVLTDLRNKLSK